MHNALSLFVSECSERLDRLESALLAIERGLGDAETLDAMFRDAHTIKGNAAVVQAGEIEWFSHIVESVLERLRNGSIGADPQLVSVLLPCIDHLRFQVALVNMTEPAAAGFADEERARLIGLLVPYLDDVSCLGEPEGMPSTASDCWAISVSFAPTVFIQGLDPVYFLQHLQTLGRIVRLETCLDGVPPLTTYEPERCYLRFEIELDSVADKQGIEDVFALVHDACELRITPPAEKNQDFIKRIRSLPTEDLYVGEMLVRVGALTAEELAAGLRNQRRREQGISDEREIGDLLVHQGFVEADVVDAVLQRQAEIRRSLSQLHRQLRVPAERVAELEELLTLIHHGLGRLARECAGGADVLSARQIPALIAQTEHAMAISHDMQRIKLEEIFHHLHRLIRDTSQVLGKQVDFLVSGGELEVERAIGDSLVDPLIHLVRNAIDHGLESATARLAAGKPVRGLIRMDAWEEEQRLVVAISDDGAGVDRERVLQAALLRGLVLPDQRIEDQALLALLFSPGFTTASHVTRISGRGVGLDAVKKSVEAVGGQISIRSFPARGTRFELRFPLCAADVVDLRDISDQRTRH